MATTFNPKLLKRQIAAHSAGVVATSLLAGLWWLGISSLHDDQRHLQREQESVARLVRNESDIRTKHGQLFQEIQLLNGKSPNLSRLNTSLPNDADFLAQLSKLANDVDLSIKSFSPGQRTDNGLEVQLTASGNYPDVCRFLDGLETVRYLCEVTQFSMVAPLQASEACALELRIRLLDPARIRPTLASAKN